MSGTDAKSGWNSGIPKAIFGGGMALKFGGGVRPVTKVKARSTNLEDVIFHANLSSRKMLNQYREGVEVVATHVGKTLVDPESHWQLRRYVTGRNRLARS